VTLEGLRATRRAEEANQENVPAPRQEIVPPPRESRCERGHQLGDIVRISNYNQGLRGVKGEVTEVTRYRVHVRIQARIGITRTVRRAHHNAEYIGRVVQREQAPQ
jgi:hypothetical protein